MPDDRSDARITSDSPRPDYESLLDATPDAVLVVRQNGDILAANPSAEALLGYGRRELVGKPVEILIPGEKRAAHTAHVQDFFQGKARRPLGQNPNLVALHKDGTVFPVDISLAPVSIDGQLMVAAVMRDLREQRAQQETRARWDRRRERLCASELIGIVILEPRSARIIETNQTFRDLVGWSDEEFRGGRVDWEAMTPESARDVDRAAFDKMVATGACPAYERDLVRKDGTRVPVVISGGMVYGTEDEAAILVADRRHQRHAESELSRAQQRLEESQRVGHVGSAEWAPGQNRAWWTEEMYRIFDIPPSAGTLTYELVLSRVHPSDRSEFDRVLREAAAQKEPFDFEHRIVWRDGSVHWIHNRGSFIPGPFPRLVGVSQDVTAKRDAESEKALAHKRELELGKLEEMSEFRARFVSMAAHELKNPLTPLNLDLEVLKAGALGPLNDAQQQTVDRLWRSAQRLGLLVQDMLDAARLQAARLSLTMSLGDLSRLVRDAASTFGAAAQKEKITLRVEASTRIELTMDANRIQQVVANLIGNAVKFTPPGGAVYITVSRKDSRARVTVADTGVGLTPEQAQQVFQPFKQVHGAVAKGVRGTGLGLYISKGIVEQHGGAIGIESGGPGKGASVWFELPLEGPSPAGVAQPKSPSLVQ